MNSSAYEPPQGGSSLGGGSSDMMPASHSIGSKAAWSAPPVLTTVLRLCGEWTAATQSAASISIVENYFKPSISNGKDVDREDVVAAHFALAQYADSQHRLYMERLSSVDFEMAENLRKETKKEYNAILAKGNNKLHNLSDRDRVRHRQLKRRVQWDENEEQRALDDSKRFLGIAMQNYIECLHKGTQHDLQIFRLTALWLENSGDDALNELIGNHLPQIPSHKWLPLMYQLSARIEQATCAGVKTEFNKLLRTIVFRAATDHPHHVLYVLFALINGESQNTPPSTSESNKVIAIRSLVNELQGKRTSSLAIGGKGSGSSNGNLKDIISSMNQLVDAYVQLAMSDIPPQTLPLRLSAYKLGQLQHLYHVGVISRDCPIDPTGKYEDLVGIDRFEQEFTLASGISKPKVVVCVGTDGHRYRQVVKGKDDMRQDAVMQQVFGLVNHWLRANPESKEKSLTIRRYKVVPLSPQAGVLEWCTGTQPLGDLLLNKDTGGYHVKYRPNVRTRSIFFLFVCLFAYSSAFLCFPPHPFSLFLFLSFSLFLPLPLLPLSPSPSFSSLFVLIRCYNQLPLRSCSIEFELSPFCLSFRVVIFLLCMNLLKMNKTHL